MKQIKYFYLLLCILIAIPVSAQYAEVYDVVLHHNVTDSGTGRSMLKATFKMMCRGVKGHTIRPILFVDKQPGTPHHFKNGDNMLINGSEYYASYETTYWENGDWLAIYNDALNPLPGTNEYYVRILVYDVTTGSYISDIPNVGWVSYTMTGASQPSTIVPDVPYIMTPSYGNNQCGVCYGSGRCSTCGGTGISPNHAPGIIAKCGACGGTGRCNTCSGRGYHY